ncbi:hypothetical protein BK126_00175 [Paenibacillus sp. FSL H7-0326]|uniref:hypothetical protein n=1 Tax=Paenibacillus sp. FSL H7-0326 TaxID=1921144 RepID=UPI00096F3BCC|nr:hypothetical protein [Paenibacillus sp. FSL H7-0326]OMC70587.1 hypothetical protein BK126_00175 [Paenibacillus sp. FSL H7-0326]
MRVSITGLTLLFILMLLSACSSNVDYTPDEIVKTEKSVTAIKRIDDYQIRLKTNLVNEQTAQLLRFQAGLRYVGSESKIEIMHGFDIHRIDLQIDDQSILPPSSSESIAIPTLLTKNEWLEENMELSMNEDQFERMIKSDGDIVLYSYYFEDGRTKVENMTRALSIKMSDIFQ